MNPKINCPLCNRELKPGSFEIGEHRKLFFSCRPCDNFYNELGISLKREHYTHATAN